MVEWKMEFKNPWLKILPLFFVVFGFFIARSLPRLDAVMPGGAPVTQILVEGIWFVLMVWGVLGHRKSYREKFGEAAYSKIAVRFFLPAASLMFAGILRSIWVAGPVVLPPALRWAGGIYFLAMGLLLEFRGVQSLGIDRVVFVYTIFPERGTLVTSKLYQFLRHPLYSAMTHMALGISLIAGTATGLLCWGVFALKLFVWSKIEEKELIERFGAGYKEYCKNVPAFFPKFKRQSEYLRLLCGRDKPSV